MYALGCNGPGVEREIQGYDKLLRPYSAAAKPNREPPLTSSLISSIPPPMTLPR